MCQQQKYNYLYTERTHLMCPDMHFGILAKLEKPFQEQKLSRSIDALQYAHPFLQSVIGAEICTEKLYYQQKEALQIPVTVMGAKEEPWWSEAFAQISRRGWDVRREALLKVYVCPGEEEFDILMIAHHLLCDGRGLLQLMKEFAECYVRGICPNRVEERLIQSMDDLPAGSGLPFFSRLIVTDANKRWAKERGRVSYDTYAAFERAYGENHPVSRSIRKVEKTEFVSIHKKCSEQGVSVNDYLIAQMMLEEEVGKVVIAADIRDQLSCYRNGAMGNYATAFSVRVRKKQQDLWALAAQVRDEVKRIRKQPQKEMLVLSCFAQMDPELLEAAAIAALGTFQSKAARFVGDQMFGYGSQDGYSITNLGKLESDVIESAAFIPPASPANRKTQGVLTVNGKMNICVSSRL